MARWSLLSVSSLDLAVSARALKSAARFFSLRSERLCACFSQAGGLRAFGYLNHVCPGMLTQRNGTGDAVVSAGLPSQGLRAAFSQLKSCLANVAQPWLDSGELPG
jgi:hypothetical protein